MNRPHTGVVTDPLHMRALAHPVRIALLRQFADCPVRVSDLATAIGEPPNSVSFHLRQLEKYGFVRRAIPDPDSDGRESWWETTGDGYAIDGTTIGSGPSPEKDAIVAAITAMSRERLRRSLLALVSDDTPRGHGLMTETVVHLTEREADELRDALSSLVESRQHTTPRDGTHPYTVAVEMFADPGHDKAAHPQGTSGSGDSEA